MLYIERRTTMSNKEKLIQYITNLTNEEAEAFIAFLETMSLTPTDVPHHLPNNPPQEQEAVV